MGGGAGFCGLGPSTMTTQDGRLSGSLSLLGLESSGLQGRVRGTMAAPALGWFPARGRG